MTSSGLQSMEGNGKVGLRLFRINLFGPKQASIKDLRDRGSCAHILHRARQSGRKISDFAVFHRSTKGTRQNGRGKATAHAGQYDCRRVSDRIWYCSNSSTPESLIYHAAMKTNIPLTSAAMLSSSNCSKRIDRTLFLV